MKHTIFKKMLLVAAVAVGLSSGPLQAMSWAKSKMTDMQNTYQGWTKEGLQRQLTSYMNRLDKEMKDVYKCIRSVGKECASHRTEVISLITTILGIVTALKVTQWGQQYTSKKMKSGKNYTVTKGDIIAEKIQPLGAPGRAMDRGAAAAQQWAAQKAVLGAKKYSPSAIKTRAQRYWKSKPQAFSDESLEGVGAMFENN